jgi:regulator of replication initiation timing
VPLSENELIHKLSVSLNNNLFDTVQEVLQKVLQMKSRLHFLNSENERLEEEIRHLKVDAEQLTLHHNKSSKEQVAKAGYHSINRSKPAETSECEVAGSRCTANERGIEFLHCRN